MSDLREQLAARMRKLWIEDNLQRGGWDLVVADECIRQMRWAFHDWPEDAYPDSGSETAAPDDWQVPK